jgi:hypothetical protein
MLKKPETKADLLPPFTIIGEPGWDTSLRQMFDDYELPPTPAVPPNEMATLEHRLGVQFPPAITRFFTTFGAVNFDGLRLLEPNDIVTMQSVWFHAMLIPADQMRLSQLVQIAEAGSDDYYALDSLDWAVYLVSHDPAGLTFLVPSFDDLIRLACIDLSCGYFGWPDEDVAVLARDLKQDLFGI